MANIIQIMDYADFIGATGPKLTGDKITECPLTDDITLEVQTNFGSFSEDVPQIANFLQIGSKLQGSTTGAVSETAMKAKNLFQVKRWESTEPARLVVKLVFYTKTSAYNDVWKPIKDLTAYTMISKKEGVYQVPGLDIRTAQAVNDDGSETTESTIANKGKLVVVNIPGVLRLLPAMVERATPTFSRQVVRDSMFGSTDGWPLWGTLDISFMGVFPATDDIFDSMNVGTEADLLRMAQ